MSLILFLTLLFQATPALDYDLYKEKVEPLLAETPPGHARCITCHSTGTAFRLQPLPKGRAAHTDEESRKNVAAVARLALPRVPINSRQHVTPLAHEARGTEYHPES